MIYFELCFNGQIGKGSLSEHDADDAFADDENENDDVTESGEMFKKQLSMLEATVQSEKVAHQSSILLITRVHADDNNNIFKL